METSKDKKTQFGMYLGKPAHLREPKTREEFAKIIGVTPQTLSHWAKDPYVIDVARNYKKLEAQVHLDEVIKNLTERAKRNNADARTFLQWIGELDKSGREKAEPLGKIEVEFITKKADSD